METKKYSIELVNGQEPSVHAEAFVKPKSVPWNNVVPVRGKYLPNPGFRN